MSADFRRAFLKVRDLGLGGRHPGASDGEVEVCDGRPPRVSLFSNVEDVFIRTNEGRGKAKSPEEVANERGDHALPDVCRGTGELERTS